MRCRRAHAMVITFLNNLRHIASQFFAPPVCNQVCLVRVDAGVSRPDYADEWCRTRAKQLQACSHAVHAPSAIANLEQPRRLRGENNDACNRGQVRSNHGGVCKLHRRARLHDAAAAFDSSSSAHAPAKGHHRSPRLQTRQQLHRSAKSVDCKQSLTAAPSSGALSSLLRSARP